MSDPREIYEVAGDAAAALEHLKKEDKYYEYHQCLLEASTQPLDEWQKRLESVEPTPSRKEAVWMVTYNKGLVLLTRGQAQESVELVWNTLGPIVSTSSESPQKLKKVALSTACWLGFLWLEGILTVSIGSPKGIADSHSRVREVVQLLSLPEDPQLKFLLCLYKSRLDFSEFSNGKLVDAKMRSARKELKQAMEIFQHKLRLSGDNSSLASASAASDSSVHQSNTNHLSLPTILQKQNQAALNLKANTEQVKGNVKKSLILCAEAQASDATALHYNNLAIVYLTHGKPALGLHAWSKALKNPTTSSFGSDGTAQPHANYKLLHNSAIGSLHARNYEAAYACLAACLDGSSIWRRRPRCWLRLAEACIGIHAVKKKEINGPQFAKVETNGEAEGVLVQSATADPTSAASLNLEKLGTPQDFEQVQEHPLPRARSALELALQLFAEYDDSLGCLSAQLSMAYICLEDSDYTTALHYADLVLSNQPQSNLDSVQHTIWKRQQATARMYASEASCATGDAVQSMRHLVGDGKDDAFDRLASDLAGGITIEMAASNPKGKARLAKAQAFVRCSASAASSHLGNGVAAKQLAMSAQAMEDAYSPQSREGSSARRALVYCMLREGNSVAALTLLRSAR